MFAYYDNYIVNALGESITTPSLATRHTYKRGICYSNVCPSVIHVSHV